MKQYAIIKNGKLSEHRLIYTDKGAAEYELEEMRKMPLWAARLQGATVAEVQITIITK